MTRLARTTPWGILAFLATGLVFWLNAGAAQASDVFQAFISHIERQVAVDKKFFADASSCTEWFYKQERERQSPPRVQGIASYPGQTAARRSHRAILTTIDCNVRYPGGIHAARKDFSHSQSTLSLSLTFYEFALVGDADDDGRYSPAELRDIVESFGINFHPELPPAHQLSTLNAKFDAIHQTLEFDVLMNGMQTLYDKGYRFTDRDKVELNRVTG